MRKSVVVTVGQRVETGAVVLVGAGVFGYATRSTRIEPMLKLVPGIQALAEFDEAVRDRDGQLVAVELKPIGASGMSVPVPQVGPVADALAELPRRVLAKLIDFIGVGFTVYGFGKLLGSPVAGLLVGWTWFALTDWGSTIGKSLCGLEVRNAVTGRPCTMRESFLRNLPIILLSFPTRLHEAVLGLDRVTYRAEFASLVLVMGLATMVMVIAEFATAATNPLKQRLGDRLAGTVVVRRRKA
ncbi:MAG: RDD family protein [Myxococcaceae bacterium]